MEYFLNDIYSIRMIISCNSINIYDSTIKYIDHFVNGKQSEDGSDLKLISENTEYIFTMVKSALLHFQKNIIHQ